MPKITSVFLLIAFLAKSYAETCVLTRFDEVPDAVKSCLDIILVNLTVPGGKTLKLNLTEGASVTFKGRTTFEYYPWKGPLVTVNGTRVTIQGDEGHIFDGQGEYYWDGLGDWGVPKPQFFTVETFGGSLMKSIYVLNSPHDVLQITNSDNVTYTNWFINNTAGDETVAPEGKFAKNTDAFDVWNSSNVLIRDAIVYNQDDCVAVRCGSNITVYNLDCHGTHGLSISVGFSNDSAPVNPLNTLTNVYFANCSLYGGENVIHIKTHNEGGYGLIANVTYENIRVTGAAKYGILIEQNYPNHGDPSNNIPIKNLIIREINGEVERDATAVSVVCAQNGCENWYWGDIDIKGSTKNNTCNYTPEGSDVCDS